MKTHEYQAKQILRISGVKVPGGILATNPLEGEVKVARSLSLGVRPRARPAARAIPA